MREVQNETLMVLHLGLGDFIICNGLVREWLRLNPDVERLSIPCRTSDLASVGFMFRDLGHRVRLVEVPDHKPYVVIFERIIPDWGGPIVNLTCFVNDKFNMAEFDREFYRIAGIDFDVKWAGFKLIRDPEVETPGTWPILIHDDPTRSFILSRKRFPEVAKGTHLQQFGTRNLFELCGVLERAEKLHAINSCVFNLMEHLNPREDQERFWHFYARPETTIPKLKQHWKKL